MSPWYLCVKLSKELNHIGSKEGDSNKLYSFFDDYKKDKPYCKENTHKPLFLLQPEQYYRLLLCPALINQ